MGVADALPLPGPIRQPPPPLHLLQYLTLPASYKVEQADGDGSGSLGYEGPRIYPPPYALRPE